MRHKVTTMVVLALMLLVSGLVVPSLSAQELPTRTITVNGVGVVRGVPDVANLQVGVDVRNINPAVAFNETNAGVETIRTALRDVNIASGDIQSASFNLWWSEIYSPETGAPTGEREYYAQQMLNVTVRDIDRAGTVISAAVEAGANTIYGLSFDIADTEALAQEARIAALADARTRAEQIAEVIGVEVGEVLFVSEGIRFPVGLSQDGFGLGGGGGTPIEPGTLAVEVQVSVTYSVR